MKTILPFALALIYCSLFQFPSTCLAQKPTANFSADPIVGCAPLTVFFDDKSSSDVLDWEWDFNNDGVYDATGDPLPSFTYNTPGYYSVRLTVSNFSDSTTIIKTRYIRVTTPPQITVNSATVCQFDSVKIRATIVGGIRPFSYFWSANDFPFISSDSTPVFAPDTTRNYTLELTDSAGCTASAQFVITVRNAPAKPTIVHVFNQLSSSVTASAYQWFLNGTKISGATAKTYVLDTNSVKSGYVTVEIRDIAGCSNKSDSLLVSRITDVPIETELASWQVYPNPTSSDLFLRRQTDAEELPELEIFDVFGRKVETSVEYRYNSAVCLIHTQQLSPGVYYLNIRELAKTSVIRFIRQ